MMIDYSQFQTLEMGEKMNYLYLSQLELHANWLRWNKYLTWAIVGVGGLLGIDIGGYV